MKIRLYRALNRGNLTGKAGEVIEVDDATGSRLVCEGRCVIVERSKPKAKQAVGRLVDKPAQED